MLRCYYSDSSAVSGKTDGAELSAYRRARLEKIKDAKDYDRSFAAERLLTEALRKQGELVLPLEIYAGEQGKPELKDGPCFNLSHSGGYVFCAVSDKPVGADVQEIREHKPALAKRFFTEEECAWIEGQEDKARAFTIVWSLKESYAKYLGGGIGKVHLNSFTVQPDKHCIAGKPVSLRYWILGEYVFAVCAEAEADCFEKIEL